MKIEIKKHESSALNLGKELSKEGIHFENVYLDGHYVGVVSVSSEEDRKRAEAALNKALVEANGDYMVALQMVARLADLAEKEVSPDEEVTVGGHKYLVSYKDFKLYDYRGNEVANCNDLDENAKKTMDKTVVLALLTSRIGAKTVPASTAPKAEPSCSCTTTTTVVTETKTTTRRKRK